MDAITGLFDILEKAKDYLDKYQYQWYKEQIEKLKLNQKVNELCEAEFHKLADQMSELFQENADKDFYLRYDIDFSCEDIYICPITSPYHYVTRMHNSKVIIPRKCRIRNLPNSGHGFYNNNK